MKQTMKYFMFNKTSDYASGTYTNLRLLSPGIAIEDIELGEGNFYSHLLDAKEKQMQYHRILVEGENMNEATVRFWVYASESRKLLVGEEYLDVEEFLSDEHISEEQKNEKLKPFLKKVITDPRDTLLHEVEGRYLWIRIRLTPQRKFLPSITKIKIIFPKNTWLQYLPDVYQDDAVSASFVERYLGMFQSMYQDMSKQIERLPKYLDPDAAGGAALEWLASWLSIEDVYLWKEEQLRYLIKHGVELYKKRGTVEYLSRMIELYTGKVPYIVEHHQLEPFRNMPEYAEQLYTLYGGDSYTFTVIVDMDGQNSNKQYHVLMRIVERGKPAHMESNIVVLEPYIFLGKYSYLGINSVLGNYGAVVLDGQYSIPFTALLENENEKGDEA